MQTPKKILYVITKSNFGPEIVWDTISVLRHQNR